MATDLASQTRTPVVLIGGPTASGKSAFALRVAEALGGWVINADASQRYRDLAVLTARPGEGETARVPHRLYGDLDAAAPGSAAGWRAAALREIRAAGSAGSVPVLVGGTGLYFKALTDGLADIPPVPPEVRAAAMARVDREGTPALHADLARMDPALAARLAPTDTQRVVRGWEVATATGRPLSAWQTDPATPPPPDLRFFRFCLLPDRDALYAAIDGRFRAMVAAGALDEVSALRARGLSPDLPAMKAVGVPELLAVLEGGLTLEEAIARAQQATRRYAKRQFTWFRNQWRPTPWPADGQVEAAPTHAGSQPCAHGWHSKNAQFPESLAAQFVSFILHSLDAMQHPN